MKWLACLFGLLLTVNCFAQDRSSSDQRYVVDIELQTAMEFSQLLQRAEQLLLAGVVLPRGEPKVTFVLHGPVLKHLMRDRYLENKRLVDLAASLSALDVIEVKACRTWLGSNGFDPLDLQPFIETVSYGVGEVEKLINEDNYLYF